MTSLNILIIGAGTVGTALGALITAGGHTVTYQDQGDLIAPKTWDIIHLTVPMVNLTRWETMVNTYVKVFTGRYLIIEASILPQALAQIDHPAIIYSPIRATEAIMQAQLKLNPKFWASVHPLDASQHRELLQYFNSIYPQGHEQFQSAESLAFGKLLEVVDFGLQITFAQQVKLVCDRHGWDFDEAYTQYRQGSVYGADYNQLGPEGAPTHWIPRVVCKPGVIGGKCVIQDALLLENADLLGDLMHYLRLSNWQMKTEVDGNHD